MSSNSAQYVEITTGQTTNVGEVVPGQFGAGQFGVGQFGADNSARQFVSDNSAQNTILILQKVPLSFSNIILFINPASISVIFFSSIPLQFQQYFLLIPHPFQQYSLHQSCLVLNIM